MEEKHTNCSNCSQLKNREEASQKEGFKREDTHLPKAAKKLVVIKAYNKSYSSRLRQLKQCRECETYYYLRTEYEFLIGGSEKKQFLNRLSEEEVQEYLGR